MKSLVAIMAVGRNNINMYFGFENLVYHTVFLRNFARPLSGAVALQWLRVAGACRGVHAKFLNKASRLRESLGFGPLQSKQIFFRLWSNNNPVHQLTLFKKSDKDSFGSISIPRPSLICWRPLSTRAKNSSSVIKVGSFSCSLTTRRTYFATRANAISLPEIAPRPCRISALYELIVAVFILNIFIL